MSSDDDETEGGADEPEKVEGERKHLFEGAISGAIKRAVERAVESSMGRLAEGPEKISNLMGEMKLPKEVLSHIYSQIDDTKTGLYRVVAKEIRDVLAHTELAEVLTNVLTKLSFEIRTEIRFVPNEAGKSSAEGEGEGPQSGAPKAPQSGLPKPEVTAHVSVKDRSKDKAQKR